MLMKRSIFPKMTNRTISPKENELRALSTFFNQSCIVGKWSPDPKTTIAWSEYSQLMFILGDSKKQVNLDGRR